MSWIFGGSSAREAQVPPPAPSRTRASTALLACTGLLCPPPTPPLPNPDLIFPSLLSLCLLSSPSLSGSFRTRGARLSSSPATTTSMCRFRFHPSFRRHPRLPAPFPHPHACRAFALKSLTSHGLSPVFAILADDGGHGPSPYLLDRQGAPQQVGAA